MTDLFLKLKYDVNKDEFDESETNIKKEKISDIVAETIRLYQHKDFSSVSLADDHKVEIFEIKITVDLSFDRFSLSTNGSNEITLGILAHYLAKN